MSQRLASTVVLVATLLAFAPSAIAVEPIRQDRHGVAVDGYDAVAYFTESKPVRGDAAIELRWRGATWHFANDENRELFRNNPERYAPQYGGYCAYAVSQGSTAKIDPEVWTVHDDKLYLNYSPRIGKKWSRDMERYIELADRHWPDLVSR